jgi:lipopolysaccharide/colanic/teichoic acid biosynthesis glycosyltransferase
MSTVFIHPYYSSPLKRGFDVIVASGLLVLLSPVLLTLFLGVWFTVGRPVIFAQKRLGLGGEPFFLYKFRTMKLGAEKLQAKLLAQNEAPAPMFKLHHDPRFIGIGRWLSNIGLDELPQLWNILRGEMSLIGPRPLPVTEAAQLIKKDSSWKFREAVRPGLLSEWSLDANRHRSLAHWKKLDLLTIQNGGLGYELKLVFVGSCLVLFWTLRSFWQSKWRSRKSLVQLS